LIICGIDPGINGGICFLGKDYKIIEMFRMPKIASEIDIKSLRNILKREINHVYLEKVHALFKSSAKATFSFGRNFGIAETVVSCLNIPYTLVEPKKWQLVCHSGVNKKLSAKDRSLVAVNQRYEIDLFLPTKAHKKPHDGLIDACLIAEYGVKCYANN
jgi:hypothetical protein